MFSNALNFRCSAIAALVRSPWRYWPFRLPGGPPLPLAPPCNRRRPFFVAGDRQALPLLVWAPHCRRLPSSVHDFSTLGVLVDGMSLRCPKGMTTGRRRLPAPPPRPRSVACRLARRLVVRRETRNRQFERLDHWRIAERLQRGKVGRHRQRTPEPPAHGVGAFAVQQHNAHEPRRRSACTTCRVPPVVPVARRG